MNIDSITNGIVIDHIAAGRGMQLYKLLNLDELDCPVAIIMNPDTPKKTGKIIFTLRRQDEEDSIEI